MADCSCGNNYVNLIYSCSDAANTGYLAYSLAKKLNAQGLGGMICLAAIGADLSGFIESAKSADKNIVIDGCPIACGKKNFDNEGLPCEHYIATDLGVEKNKTVITQ